MRRALVRSKSSLFLLELMVVLLLFALSSTVCVKLFAQAKLISRHSADTTMSVLHAQQVAERIKSQGEQALTDQGAGLGGAGLDDGLRRRLAARAPEWPGGVSAARHPPFSGAHRSLCSGPDPRRGAALPAVGRPAERSGR